jgi:hypothetical protein
MSSNLGPGVNAGNKLNRGNYVDTLNEVFNGETSGMSPGQQAALRAQVGLDKYPHSKANIQEPGGPQPVSVPQVPPGATAQPNPLVDQLLQKHGFGSTQ